MLAVLPDSHLQPRLGELPDPRPEAGEVLVRIAASAINHADLLQLQGRYPAPPGESEVPGLECAGTIIELGEGVDDWQTGDRVMALLAGGGHGELAAVPAGQLMPVPENFDLTQAAALPEAALTGWTNLVTEGQLQRGETVLILGASSGMGTFAVQLARELGARTLAAGRNRHRLEPLLTLGADELILLGEDFVEQVHRVTEAEGDAGVQLVLDLVGGEHLARALEVMATRGRLVLLGLLAGRRAELDLGLILRKRLHLVGSVLRGRSRAEKAELVASFRDFGLPRLADGRLKPTIDRVLPFSNIADAYAAMAGGGALGKIVVEMS